ncbi:MAG: ABC transporter ATP-binding protein [Pseudomonas sp.]
MPLLQVRQLDAEFHTGKTPLRVIEKLSFELDRGQTLAIVGESGSGKSVTAMSILGLLRPPGKITGGEVIFDGQDLLRIGRRKLRRLRGNRISMVFQDPMTALNPMLRIGYQIGEVLHQHHRLDRRQARTRAIQLLEQVGIHQPEARLDCYPHQLSGGMRQRVMIAIAIACQPQLLIADEPTTALDVTIQAQIVEQIKTLRDAIGMAVIWITHDLGVVADFADRVLVMYAGQVAEDAPVEALYATPRHPYTRGLLASLPRLDMSHGEALPAIPGSPPELARRPPGCQFAPRCPMAQSQCSQNAPALVDVGPGHRVACWRAHST